MFVYVANAAFGSHRMQGSRCSALSLCRNRMCHCLPSLHIPKGLFVSQQCKRALEHTRKHATEVSECALMRKERESLSLKTDKPIEGRIWIWCLAVQRKWTAIQCHHGPFRPVLTLSKTIRPCLHRIVCQANPSCPVFESRIESAKRVWVDDHCKGTLTIEIFDYQSRATHIN